MQYRREADRASNNSFQEAGVCSVGCDFAPCIDLTDEAESMLRIISCCKLTCKTEMVVLDGGSDITATPYSVAEAWRGIDSSREVCARDAQGKSAA